MAKIRLGPSATPHTWLCSGLPHAIDSSVRQTSRDLQTPRYQLVALTATLEIIARRSISYNPFAGEVKLVPKVLVVTAPKHYIYICTHRSDYFQIE